MDLPLAEQQHVHIHVAEQFLFARLGVARSRPLITQIQCAWAEDPIMVLDTGSNGLDQMSIAEETRPLVLCV